jgi:hypothetical protein
MNLSTVIEAFEGVANVKEFFIHHWTASCENRQETLFSGFDKRRNSLEATGIGIDRLAIKVHLAMKIMR